MKHADILKSIFAAVALWLAAATALPLMADTWTDPNTGYTWSYRILNGSEAEIYEDVGYKAISSRVPIKGSVTIPESLGGKPVTRIGNYALYGCGSVTRFVIPDNVTSIGISAFSGCRELRSVNIPSAVNRIGDSAFRECGLVGVLRIPNGVTSIAPHLFDGCSGLAGVIFSDNITSIGYDAFSGCSGFVGTLSIPDSVVYIGDRAFTGCSGVSGMLVIPDSVASIGCDAFSGCENLSGISMSTNVTILGSYAFERCTALKSVKISDGIIALERYVFAGCTNLTSVVLPSNVKIIGDHAFSGCNRLVTVSIPEGVTSIDDYAFAGCSELGDVMIPETVENIGHSAFSGCYKLLHMVVPDAVRSIGPSAFSHCSGLVSVTMPDGLSKISDETFRSCNSLRSIVIPESVQDVERFAFKDCNELSELVIDNGVVNINADAFAGCSKLERVSIPASVRYVSSSAFNDCSGLTNISVAIDNMIYEAYNGILLLKGGQTLIQGANGDVVIPNGVTNIADEAFRGLSGLTSVIIPDSVTSIGHDAFYMCNMLTSAYLSRNLSDVIDFPYGTKVYRYKPEQTVSFDVSDGLVLPTEKVVAFASLYGLLPVPKRTGYTFKGWMLEDQTVTSNTCVLALDDHVLVAQWKANRYAVVFDANGGIGGATNEFDYSSQIIAPEVSRDGYTFVGWTPEVDATVPASNVTYTAQWKINQYTVVFDANGGGLGESALPRVEMTLDYETEVAVPEVLREGCTFEGWLPAVDANVPASNVTYVAQWKVWSVCLDSADSSIRELYPHDYENITNVVLMGGITEVQQDFFNGCHRLVNVSMSDTITNIGNSAFSGCGDLTEMVIPEGVTRIGNWAFQGCASLSQIVIPDSVKEIGYSAFEGCDSLVNVTVPGHIGLSGLNGFDRKGCKEVTISSSSKTICSSAFSECTNITHIVIPYGVTDIGEGAFSQCKNLQSVVIPDSVTNIGANAFSYCSSLGGVKIPDRVKCIEGNTFNGCTGLTNVGIGAGVKHIESWAFWGCSSLREIAVPKSVESINYSAFSGCSNLTEMVLPFVGSSRSDSSWFGYSGEDLFGWIFGQDWCWENSGVYSGWTMVKQYYAVGQYIEYCIPSSLRTVVITDETEVGPGAFMNCDMLESVTIPDCCRRIEHSAFYGCAGLRQMVVPVGVESIGDLAFHGCSGLERIVVPGHLGSQGFDRDMCATVEISEGSTDVPIGAFMEFSNISSILIPEGVTNIGYYAFHRCDSLRNLTIPTSVRMLGSGAFCECHGLKSISILSQDIFIPGYAGNFAECTNVTDVIVPGWQCNIPFDAVTNLVVLDGASEIRDNAFLDCKKLERICIPNSVTNIGDSAFAGCARVECITIPQCVCDDRLSKMFPDAYQSIKEVNVCERTEALAPYVFYGCDSLERISIPPSIVSIGDHAFLGCDNLKRVDISDFDAWLRISFGLYANPLSVSQAALYLNGVPLEIVGRYCVPDGVYSIPSGSFRNQHKLTEVILPEGLARIEAGAFEGCSAFASISIPDSVVDWGFDSLPPAMRDKLSYDADGFIIYQGWLLDYANKGAATLTVPKGVVGIGSYALSEMYDLETVMLPQSLKYIAEGSFCEDTYLDNLVIPDGVEVIGEGAFEDCSYLQTLTLGKGIKSVRSRAFAGCTQLSSAVFADGLSEIGAEAFSGCWRMQSVSLPVSTEKIAASTFNGCSSLTGVTVPTHGGKMSEWFSPVYSQILDVTVPDGETEVRAEMFKGCSSLRSVSLPEGITNIASSAFENCDALAELTLPGTLVSLGDAAFRNCGNLSAIVLPECVERIGEEIFANCGMLSELTLSRKLAAIPARAFAGCWSLDSFVVPASVTYLGDRFVSSGTTAIYYLGNAPECQSGAYEVSHNNWMSYDVYGDANGSLTSYVILGTKGWDGRPNSRDIPQSWNGRDITIWQLNVTFDAAGGTVTPSSDVFVVGGTYSTLPVPMWEGHTFVGWKQEGEFVSAGTIVSPDIGDTLVAQWTVNQYTVTFDAAGGTGGTTVTQDYGTEIAAPEVTRTGYTFVGWTPAVPATVPANDVIFIAQWEKNPEPTPDPEPDLPVVPELHNADEALASPAPTGAASEYNGYLYDEKSGAMTGTIQVKVGKPGKKDGKASVKATVIIGSKKVTLKGADKGKTTISPDGPTEIELVGGEACEIVLGAEGLSGSYGTYLIDGSRNFFKSKSEANAAGNTIAKWVGALAVKWSGGTASVTIDKKGKAKASIVLSNGTKGTATSSLLVGDEWHCVPVMVTKKMNVAFTLWLSADGSEALVSGLEGDAVVGKTGSLKAGAKFNVDTEDALWTMVSATVYTEYLPNDVSVAQKGTKWELPKAGKLTMKKGVLDDSKKGKNPSGLKLTPKKDGTFTGSFKVYFAEKDKLKSKTANVTGIVINGVGHGTVTIKGVGSVRITIE